MELRFNTFPAGSRYIHVTILKYITLDGQTVLSAYRLYCFDASLQHGVSSEVPLFCSNFSSMSSSTNYYSNHTHVFIRLKARRVHGWNSNYSSSTQC
jgi:hypothetical protein